MGYSKDWLTEKELRRLLDLPNLEERYEVWLLLLYTPALRDSEALNIRVRDLILEKKNIKVNGGRIEQLTISPLTVLITGSQAKKSFCERSDLKQSVYILFTQTGTKKCSCRWVKNGGSRFRPTAKSYIKRYKVQASRYTKKYGNFLNYSRLIKIL